MAKTEFKKGDKVILMDNDKMDTTVQAGSPATVLESVDGFGGGSFVLVSWDTEAGGDFLLASRFALASEVKTGVAEVTPEELDGLKKVVTVAQGYIDNIRTKYGIDKPVVEDEPEGKIIHEFGNWILWQRADGKVELINNVDDGGMVVVVDPESPYAEYLVTDSDGVQAKFIDDPEKFFA